jgi:hypothetical protein
MKLTGERFALQAAGSNRAGGNDTPAGMTVVFAVFWEIPEFKVVERCACQWDLTGGQNGDRFRWKRKQETYEQIR